MLEVCREWGIPPTEFRSYSERDKAEMTAFVMLRRKTAALKDYYDTAHKRHKDGVAFI